MAPHERLALGTALLLLVGGAGVRLARTPAVPAAWQGESGDAPAAVLGARVADEVARERRSAVPLAEDERIDVNRADAAELRRLPRVGPKLAERIIAHREAHGPFRTLADLDAVSGIGPVMLAQIAPHVALPAAPPPRVAPGAARTLAAPSAGDSAAPLDLNRATAEELDALPGIGPVLAERIVRWRSEHGPFRTVDDLARVSGISARMVERLAPRLRVGS